MPPITGKKSKDKDKDSTVSSPDSDGKPQSSNSLVPYWRTSDGETIRLYLGEVRDVLARLPARSVQCVVTSPPYWGLRDYGTASWEGGKRDCDHSPERRGGRFATPVSAKQKSNPGSGTISQWNCPCGARRVDRQIGSEPSPDCGSKGQAQCGGCFVCTMVAVFREVRRVLRDDGTLWLNLGDSYGASDLPSGNLIGVPWRVALALQADGWVLRQDIIWAKPAPMPESVTNRCTKAHEYLFLLAKGDRYYYDAEAIKGKSTTAHLPLRTLAPKQASKEYDGMVSHNENHASAVLGRVDFSNKRSVWTIPSRGYPGAHFATFPEKMVEPCILAGTSEGRACAECGAPWSRIVEDSGRLNGKVRNEYGRKDGSPHLQSGFASRGGRFKEKISRGWAPGCRCGSGGVKPCIVLDPFVGSGTTLIVANELGRWGIGIDLSEDYLRNQTVKRVEGALLRRPATSGLTGRVRQAVTGLGKKVELK